MTGSKWQWLLKTDDTKTVGPDVTLRITSCCYRLNVDCFKPVHYFAPCHQRQQGFVEQHIKYPRNLHACSDYILSQYYGLSVQCR